MENISINIDEADISNKDESNLNEKDTSININKADADITDSPNTVQSPHEYKERDTS